MYLEQPYLISKINLKGEIKMIRVQKLKTFAINHPYITIVMAGVYAAILVACVIHDLKYYGFIKE